MCFLDYWLHFYLPDPCGIAETHLSEPQTRSKEFKRFTRRCQEQVDHGSILLPSVISILDLGRLTLSSISPTTGGSYSGASGPSKPSHLVLSSSVSGAGGGISAGTEPRRGLLAAF